MFMSLSWVSFPFSKARLKDELLASPMAFKSVHEDLKEQDPFTPPPRRPAGHKRIGEDRPALVIAQGAFGAGATPAKKRVIYSMENALTEGFKQP